MKIHIPLALLKGARLGDVVQKTAQSLGLKRDCPGCEKRRTALNRFRLPK